MKTRIIATNCRCAWGRRSAWAGLLFAVVAGAPTVAKADSFFLTDGTIVFGDATKTAKGYLVHTKEGDVELSDGQIHRILKDRKPTTAPVAAAPAHAPVKKPGTSVSSNGDASGGTAPSVANASVAALPPVAVISKSSDDAEANEPIRYAAAFAVAPDLAVTSGKAIAGASAIELQTADGASFKGEVVRTDDASGLALVRFTGGSVPCLQIGLTQSPAAAMQCLGFPDIDAFTPTPQIMEVKASAIAGAVAFHVAPRLAGGPLLQNGSVVGVEMATKHSNPARIAVVSLDVLKAFLKFNAQPGTPAADPASAVMQLVATK